MITLIIIGLVVTALLLGYVMVQLSRTAKQKERIALRLQTAIGQTEKYTPEEQAYWNQQRWD